MWVCSGARLPHPNLEQLRACALMKTGNRLCRPRSVGVVDGGLGAVLWRIVEGKEQVGRRGKRMVQQRVDELQGEGGGVIGVDVVGWLKSTPWLMSCQHTAREANLLEQGLGRELHAVAEAAEVLADNLNVFNVARAHARAQRHFPPTKDCRCNVGLSGKSGVG